MTVTYIVFALAVGIVVGGLVGLQTNAALITALNVELDAMRALDKAQIEFIAAQKLECEANRKLARAAQDNAAAQEALADAYSRMIAGTP